MLNKIKIPVYCWHILILLALGGLVAAMLHSHGEWLQGLAGDDPVAGLAEHGHGPFAGALAVVSVVLCGYMIFACRQQMQKKKMAAALEAKFAELYVSHERQAAAEKTLERQLKETRQFASRLRTSKELLGIRKSNRAELYRVINSSPVALVVIDDTLQHVINCNDTAVQMFNVKDKEHFVGNFRRYFPETQPDGRNTAEFLAATLAESRRNGGGDFECAFVTQDGEPLPLWVSHRFMEVNGQRLRFTYLQDMRREKRGMEIMRTRQQEMELLIAHLPVAVEIIDTKTLECVFANQAFLKLVGLSSMEERQKMSFKDILAEAQRDGQDVESKLREVLQNAHNQGSAHAEWSLVRHDGALLETKAFSQIIRYQYKECILTVFQNVTETLENTNLLVDSVAAASSLNEMRGRFLQKFNYEARVPLKAILRDVDVLTARPAAAEQDKCLADLRSETTALQGLVEHLLDWEGMEENPADNPVDNLTSFSRPAEEEEKKPASVSRSAKILLAEDNSVNRMVVRELLRARGFAVDEVEDGEAAVAAVQRERYDAVLMDINMPKLDGDGAARRIREEGFCMPIIALTADASAEERALYTEAGITDIVNKPVRIEELVEMLREVLPGGE